MKNKKLVYVLIPLVLVVWGMIVYRVLKVVNGNSSNQTHANTIVLDAGTENFVDTFSIHSGYRDPFRAKVEKKIIPTENKIVSAPAANKEIKKKTEPPTKTWPGLIYSGLIKNQKSNQAFAIVQVNGQSHIMKVGDIENGIELIKIGKDSIEVKYQEEKRFVRK